MSEQHGHANIGKNQGSFGGRFKPSLRQCRPWRAGVKAKRRHQVVHRIRKFVEVGSGRIGYAMTEAVLSEVSNGARWNPDPSFSVADALLADPEFASVLKKVLRQGHVMVPALEEKKRPTP